MAHVTKSQKILKCRIPCKANHSYICSDFFQIYVTDREANEVRCYTFVNGQMTFASRFGKLGTEPDCLRRPTGIAVDGVNGRLIIAGVEIRIEYNNTK